MREIIDLNIIEFSAFNIFLYKKYIIKINIIKIKIY